MGVGGGGGGVEKRALQEPGYEARPTDALCIAWQFRSQLIPLLCMCKLVGYWNYICIR